MTNTAPSLNTARAYWDFFTYYAELAHDDRLSPDRRLRAIKTMSRMASAMINCTEDINSVERILDVLLDAVNSMQETS